MSSITRTRVRATAAGILAGGALAYATLRFWPEALGNVMTQSFLPHGFCFLWNRQLLTLHVVSDSIIAVSYVAISALLSSFAYKWRRSLRFAWFFILFGAFIVECAATHVMEVLVLWKPLYWLSGDVKLATAIVSLGVAIGGPFVFPELGKLLRAGGLSARNERRFFAASDSSHDSFFILESVRDAEGVLYDFRFAFANVNGARLLSSTRAELEGKLLCENFPDNRTDGFFERYKRVVETGLPIDEELTIDAAGINASWLHMCVLKLEDGVAITTTNISARKSNEFYVAGLAAFTTAIFKDSPFATVVTDLDGTITSINPAAEQLFAYAKRDLVALHTPLIFFPDGEKPKFSNLTANATNRVSEETEWRLVRRDGSYFDAQLTVSPLTAEAHITGFIFVAYDITARKQAEARVSHLAQHDALTGLATRRLFYDRMDVAFARADRSGHFIGLLMLDLDHFKEVNDFLGHDAGDALLAMVAQRVEGAVRGSDTVARMGGDEFVVLLDELRQPADAEIVARTIIDSLREPVVIGAHTVSPSASVGICVYPGHGDSPEALLKNADEAMYYAKSAGRNRYQLFDTDMASASARRRDVRAALSEALVANEFELYYQPQVCIADGRVTGVEALIRWHSVRLGPVMPSDFIALLEESGQILAIGQWILRTACAQGRQLQRELGRPITIAVNISPRQFQQIDFIDVVSRALADFDLSPASLELELTENILVTDSGEALRTLDKIRALGVRVALDDFGTGFSSLAYITRFRVDRLKIDQSFVRGMVDDPNCGAVADAVIALGASLAIGVVAEGVETTAQLELLRSKGCGEVQGYLLAKPMPFTQTVHAIRELEGVRVA